MHAEMSIAEQYQSVRTRSETLCAHLPVDDFGLQAMPETSPLKWHLAHVSWFFETFILRTFNPDYRVFDEAFESLFNSYYHGVGRQHPRAQRHLLSRPTLEQIHAYRKHIDRAMQALLTAAEIPEEVISRTRLGLHHEAQHQELMLTDLKYNLACNPTFPAYWPAGPGAAETRPVHYTAFEGGLTETGASGEESFSFDNEHPRHAHWLEPFELASRQVSNAEYLSFIEDSGYTNPMLWLSDGWSTVQTGQWQHPLYWRRLDGVWHEFTLHGLVPLDANRPAVHLSYYEADAFARWAGCRLPTEQEWEHAARGTATGDSDSTGLHPQYAPDASAGYFGVVWEWTSSPYSPYPGYRPAAGAIGEYNGKFMCNQQVLRGSSCLTPAWHARASYRNFFYPPDRWQFSGMRLARDTGRP